MKTLWLVVTRTCNLDCSYCYQGSHKWTWQKEKGLVKHISDDVLKNTLAWALDWITKGDSLNVVLYGGEPLLMKDLIFKWVPIYKSMFESQGKRITFTCTSNGTKLTHEVREFFDEHEIGVMVSMDGPPWIHDKQRTYFGGNPSWESIPSDELLKWRPDMQIAWQLDPQRVPKETDLVWMRERGFRCINFNLNWNSPWTDSARIELQEFMRAVGRRAIRERNDKEGFRCNLFGKFNELFMKDDRDTQPCGTGLSMLAVSPEGWLYPSQEMIFTVVEPGRAPGTEAYYRVGDVGNTPVIDAERLTDVSTITNDEMKTPPGFDCNNCAAKVISFGGCHCRYVGSDGTDPSNRYDVLPGWCQTEQAWVTGFLQAAVIEKYITFRMNKPAAKPHVHQPVGIENVFEAITRLEKKFDSMDVMKVEKV